MRKVSLKRKQQLSDYKFARIRYLIAHPMCGVEVMCGGASRARDIHHKWGRNGDRLLDEAYWVGSCRDCHNWIHANPAKAKELGLLIDRAGNSGPMR